MICYMDTKIVELFIEGGACLDKTLDTISKAYTS